MNRRSVKSIFRKNKVLLLCTLSIIFFFVLGTISIHESSIKQDSKVTTLDSPFADVKGSALTNPNISVYTDKAWYKNNSYVNIYGNLDAVESTSGYTVIIEIYFEAEATPTYTFFNTTDASGNYEYSFLMQGTNKEGNFTAYVGVVGEAGLSNSNSYNYDGTAPVVGTVNPLASYTNVNPTLTWSDASDNNVSTGQLTYLIYRAVKIVGVAPNPSDYAIVNGSVGGTVWTQPGTLTTNRDYHYIVSVRDLAGNAANYTNVNTTYDTSKPIIAEIKSPIPYNVYANTMNITARITDSIPFSAWAHVTNANGTYNSSQINLPNTISDDYGAIWTIPANLSGFYNVTIFANDSLGNLRVSAPVTFEVTTQAPVFSDVWDNSPDYTQTGNVTVRIREITGQQVEDAILSWSLDNVIFTDVPMTIVNGTVNNTDNYWTAAIPQHQYYYGAPRARIYYKIWANNTFFGNVNITSTYSYYIEDYAGCDFTALVQTPSPVEFYRQVSISVNFTKPVNSSGVDFSTAFLEYKNGSIPWSSATNLTLTISSGTTLNANFQSSSSSERIPAHHYGDTIYYRIWSKDRRGNWNVSQEYSYTVQDNSAPRVVNRGLFSSPVNYNQTGRIYVNFTDVYTNTTTISSGINDATAQIFIELNNSGSWNAYPLTKFYGDASSSSWGYNVSNYNYNTVVKYYFVIDDNFGNQLISANYSYTVVDQYAPTYSLLGRSPLPSTYDQVITITIRPAEDPGASGIDRVELTFRNSSGTYGPFAMGPSGSDYISNVLGKQAYGQSINVSIEIYDNAGNKKTVPNYIFSIEDDIDPNILGITLEQAGDIQYYERMNVMVNATDITAGDPLPAGIKNVTLQYQVNAGPIQYVLMNMTSGNSYNGTWNALLPYFDHDDDIAWTIVVYDNFGNTNTSVRPVETIKDDIDPTFNVPILVGSPIEYDEVSNITIRVFEETSPAYAAGVSTVILNYSIDSGPWNTLAFALLSGDIYDGTWNATIGPYDYGTQVKYFINITDQAGNNDNTINYTYTIDDFDAPDIIEVDYSTTRVYYYDVNVTVNATEITSPAFSSGISSVYLNYSVDGGSMTARLMNRISGNDYDGVWNTSIPKQDWNKVVQFNITVIDVKGNSRISSSNYSYTVADDVIPNMNTPVHTDITDPNGIIEYFEEVEITIYIEEVPGTSPTLSSGVNTVTLNYTKDGSLWNSVLMTKKTGVGGIYYGTWNYTFGTSEFVWNQTVNYTIVVEDRAGLTNSNGFFTFFVNDTLKPTVSSVKLENPPSMYYTQANITGRVVEPAQSSSVNTVWIQYSIGAGWVNIPALNPINGTNNDGYWSVILPNLAYGLTVQVRFNVTDGQGNERITTPISFSVQDNVDPVNPAVLYDSDNEYYENNEIKVRATEPALASGVASVSLNYSVNGGSQVKLTLVPYNGTIYDGYWSSAIPRQNYGSVVRFNITIKDVAGNELEPSTNYTYTVQDHIDPTSGAITFDDNNNHDGTVEYFERATVRINVQEVSTPTTSSGILSVILNHSSDGQNWQSSAMFLESGTGVFSGLYNFTFPYYDWNTTVTYSAILTDNAGNSRQTSQYSFTVHDKVKPTLGIPFVANIPVMYYENGVVKIQISEISSPARSAGINTVIFNYTTGGSIWNQLVMVQENGTLYSGYWNVSVPIYNYSTQVQYKIRAIDRESNFRVSSIYSYTVGDDVNALITSILTNSTGNYMYYRPVEVNATVTENINGSGVSGVELIYSVSGVLQTPITMTRVSGTVYNGAWSAVIPAQDYGSLVLFNFTVTDNATNELTEANSTQYTVDDDIDTNIGAHQVLDGNDNQIEYDENAEVTIVLSEVKTPTRSSGIGTVILEYTTNSWGSSNNITMNQKSGLDIWSGTWNCSMPLFSWADVVEFTVHVADLAGNIINSTVWSFTIYDKQKPTVSDVKLENPPAEYNTTANITGRIVEPIRSSTVKNVTVQFSTGAVWINLIASPINGTNNDGYWSALLYNFPYGTTVQVRFLVYDQAGNDRITTPINFLVQDNVAPVYSNLNFDSDNEYNEANAVTIRVTEDVNASGVVNVYLNYSVNVGSQAQLIMGLLNGSNYDGYWNCLIPRQNYLDVVSFNLTFKDIAGNILITPVNFNYTVQDHVDPTHGAILLDDNLNHDSVIEYFERATVRINVQEVSSPTSSAGIASVVLNHSSNGINWTQTAMLLESGGGVYAGLFNHTFSYFSWNTTVSYTVIITDAAGNVVVTPQGSFTVDDTVKPTVAVPVVVNSPVMYHENGTIRVQITEPVAPANASGIDYVYVNFTSDGSTWNQLSMSQLNGTIYNGYWNVSLPMYNYSTQVQYRIRAYDREGNFRASSTYSYSVGDDIAPIATSHVTNSTLNYMYYRPVEVNVTVTEHIDGSGVSDVELIYSVNGVLKTPITMTMVSGTNYNGVWRAVIPVQNYGSIVRYNFTSVDAALNVESEAENDQYTVDDDRDPVEISTYYTDGNDDIIEYDEAWEVIISLQEETVPAYSSGIAVVTLQYTNTSWASNRTVTMTQKTGIDKWSGTWSYVFPATDFAWDYVIEFTVHVTDEAGNHINTTVNSTTIEDRKDVILNLPSVQNAPIEYDEYINVTVLLQEPVNASGVASVLLNYSYGAGWTDVPMVLDSGDSFSGTWRFDTGLVLEYGTTFQYRIIATDNDANTITSSLYQFTVNDFDNPVINEITLTDNGDANMPIVYSERGIIKINVTEVVSPNYSSGIDIVRVYYEINNSGSELPATTLKESVIIVNYEEIWNATIPRQNYGAFVEFYVTATDKEGNLATSSVYNYTVNDTVSPSIGSVTRANLNYYQNANITAIVSEISTPTFASGVSLVQLNVSYNGGSDWGLLTMNLISGNEFTGTYSVLLENASYWLTAPSTRRDIKYRVIAEDNEGNSIQSSEYQFTITDNVKPNIVGFYQVLASPDFNESQTIDVHVLEGVNSSGVNPSGIYLYYQNSSGTFQVPLTRLANGTPSEPYIDNWWRASIPAESNYGENITYYVQVYDYAGNVETSATYWYLISDTYDVDIINVPIVYNLPVEYDENAIIRMNASEPALASGIDSITLRWRNSTSGWINVSMSNIGDDEYEGFIGLNNYSEVIEWHVMLEDVAGNVRNYSAGADITIEDNTAPAYVGYTTNPSVQAGLDLYISATLTEPLEASGLDTAIGSAKIHWNRSAGPPVLNNISNMIWHSGNQTFGFLMPQAPAGATVSFRFEVWDLAGNFINTSIFSYITNDTSAPVIVNHSANAVIEYYEQLNVTVGTTDIGSGVAQVLVNYTINGSTPWTTSSGTLFQGDNFDGLWYALVPRQEYGSTISFWIKVIDGSGNETTDNNSGNYYNCSVTDNALPVIDTIRINGTTVASADVEYYEDSSITARVYKSQYATLAAPATSVILNYSTSGTWVQTAMSLISGTSKDGTWRAIIPAEVPFNTIVNFSIYAVDHNSNSTTTSMQSYTIKDHVSPFSTNLNVVGLMYNDTFNITIRIYEDSINASNISSVTLFHSISGASQAPLAMSLVNGTVNDGYWSVNIGPFNYGEDIDISVNCLDNGGNTLASAAVEPTITIQDDFDPSIDSVSNPGMVYYYDDVNITVDISEVETPTESSGIDPVQRYLLYSTNGGSDWTQVSLTVIGSFNEFNSSFYAIIPEQDYGTTVFYKINVRDQAGNTINSSQSSYDIDDNILPTITTFYKVRPVVNYNETIEIRANITEETTPKFASGVENATLNYSIVSQGTWNTIAMTNISGNTYSGEWSATIPNVAYGETVQYYIICYDYAGNKADSGFNKSYVVDDSTNPTYNSTNVIISDTNNQDGTIVYTETALIQVQLIEELNASGIQLAILNYSVDGGAYTSVQKNAPMNGTRINGWWEWTITPKSYNSNVSFLFIARDYENNEIITSVYHYIVNDTTAPVIGTPVASTPVYYTANGTVEVQVTENIAASGVSEVWINYSVNSGAMISYNASLKAGNVFNGIWNITLPAYDWNDSISYNVTAIDNEQQVSVSSNYNFMIIDSTAPIIGVPVVENAPIQYNENATISVIVSEPQSALGTDAAGVDRVRLYYSVDSVPKGYLDMTLQSGDLYSGNYTRTLPQFNYGSTITYYIWADDRDASGTPRTTTTSSFVINDDSDPVISDINENNSLIVYTDFVMVFALVQDGFGAITSSSGIDPDTGVVLHYQVDSNPWQQVEMARDAGGDDHNAYFNFTFNPRSYNATLRYYIEAVDIAGNTNLSLTYNYTVNDTTAPIPGIPWDNNPEYTETPIIQVVVTEPATASGVASVTMNYQVNGGSLQTASASLSVGDAHSGTWQVSLSMFNYNDLITYNFTVVDVEGNTAVSDNDTFIVGDTAIPNLGAPVVVNTPVSYDVYPRIEIQVEEEQSIEGTDASGIASVEISYISTGWSTPLVTSMNLTSGDAYLGDWRADLPHYFNYSALISFNITANDTAGNSRTTSGSFVIVDEDVPFILNISRADMGLVDGTIEYNETVNVTCRITEAPAYNTSSGIALTSVRLYWRVGGVGPWSSILMQRLTGDKYDSTWNATIPQRGYGAVVYYFIEASDLASNELNSTTNNYTVDDIHAPDIGATSASPPVYYTQYPRITVQVKEESNGIVDYDASGVAMVWINYSVNSGPMFSMSTTIQAGDNYDGVWNVTLPGYNWNDTISYNITAIDNAGEQSISGNYTFVIRDATAPTIGVPVVENAPIQYNENATISVIVSEPQSALGTDAAGVDRVRLYYFIDGSPQSYLNMTLQSGDLYSGNYTRVLPRFNYGSTITYYIYADDRDASGTPRTTSNYQFTIGDNVDPDIGLVDENDSVVEYYEYVLITAPIQDGFSEVTLSSGIDAVTGITLHYKINNNPWQQVSMVRSGGGDDHDANYTYTMSPRAYGSNISYYIEAEDQAGNIILSGNYSYNVTDLQSPSVSSPLDNNPQYSDTPSILINVTEPSSASGLSRVMLNYSVNSGVTLYQNATLISGSIFDGTWEVTLSMFDYNDIILYNFTCFDLENNTAISINENFIVRDAINPVLNTSVVVNAPIYYYEYPRIDIQIEEEQSIEGTNASGIASVEISYISTGWPTPLVLSMNLTSGDAYLGDWRADLPHYFNYSALISFNITANDTAGNSRTTTGSFTIYDVDAPIVTAVTAADAGFDGYYEYDEIVTITAFIEEDPVFKTSSGIDLGSVLLYYRFNNGTWSSKSMGHSFGDEYNGTFTTTLNPRPYGTLVEYKVFVHDQAVPINEDNSTVYNYTVTDIDNPLFSSIKLNNLAPGAQPVYYYQGINFSITASEASGASGVASVVLNYSVNGTALQTVPVPLILPGNQFLGEYRYNLNATPYGTTYNYSYTITDSAGNSVSTPFYYFEVLDNRNPVVSDAYFNQVDIEYWEYLVIFIDVDEEILPTSFSSGIQNVDIIFPSWNLTVPMENLSASMFSNTFRYNISSLLPWNTPVNFSITVSDCANNTVIKVGSYRIKDLVKPVIITHNMYDQTNATGVYEYDDTLTVRMRAIEALNASGIDQVLLNYSINNGSMVSVPMSRYFGTSFNGNWTYTLGTYAFNTSISYNITVIDNAGNFANTTTVTKYINDFDNPTYSIPLANNGSIITYLDPIEIVINVSKPINSAPIDFVSLTYQINADPINTETAMMIGAVIPGYQETWSFTINRTNAFDNIIYSFSIYDVNGNSNSTPNYPIQVIDNMEPILDAIYLNGESNSSLWSLSFDEVINVTIKLLETDGITNDSGIDEVFLLYRSTGTEDDYINATMGLVGGTMFNGTWYFEVPNLVWSGTVWLKIEARDNTGLEENYFLQTFVITQTDTYAPAISGVTILPNESFYPGYYDINEPQSFYTIDINATLTTPVNSSGLNPSKIFVQFKAMNETSWINATMSYTGVGDVYTAKIWGLQWQQDVEYRIFTENNYGELAIESNSSLYTYYAVDRKSPARITDTIGEIIFGTEVDVSISLNEPVNASGIDDSSVFVRFKFNLAPTWTYNSLSNDGFGTFSGQIDGAPALTTVYYQFVYADIVGNNYTFPAPPSNYSYLVGDIRDPIYNDTKTVANAPSTVPYNTPLGFSVFAYDEDSTISAITISYKVGSQAPVLLSTYVQVGSTDEFIFTIPGQSWDVPPENIIRIYVVNVTDSSGNTIEVGSSSTRISVTITDLNKPILDNASIQVIDPYQVWELNHSVTINFSVSEPVGASGLTNVSLVYTNSTNHTMTISSIMSGTTGTTLFSYEISDQKPFTRIYYYFLIRDRAGNVLNTSMSNRTFKMEYFEERDLNYTVQRNLKDPVNSSRNLVGFNMNSTDNITIRITEYDTNPQAQGPRFTYHDIASKIYKMELNNSGAILQSGRLLFYYDKTFINISAFEESTLRLARYTPNGYEPLDGDILDIANSRIIFNDTYTIQNFMFTSAVPQYTEYFAILGQYKVPVPTLVSPVLGPGSVLYGTVNITISTQTTAQNVSLYYKSGLGGNYTLVNTSTTPGTLFSIIWNTTALGDLDNVIIKLEATNLEGFSGTWESSSFFFKIQNSPDAVITLPPTTIFTGVVQLNAISTIPARSATFFFQYNNGTVDTINITLTGVSWDGYYPFVGTCFASVLWNTTWLGNEFNIWMGVNMTSYYDGQLNGTHVFGSYTIDVINIPNPSFVNLTIASGEVVYGSIPITVTTDYPGITATFYYFSNDLGPTNFTIGTVTSSDGGYTFSIVWNTTNVEYATYVDLHVNITNIAGHNGTETYENSFTIRNRPVLYGDEFEHKYIHNENYLLINDGTYFTGTKSLVVIVEMEPTPDHAVFGVIYDRFLPSETYMELHTDNTSQLVNLGGTFYYYYRFDWDTRYVADADSVYVNVTVFNNFGYNVSTNKLLFFLRNEPTPTIVLPNIPPTTPKLYGNITITANTTYEAVNATFYFHNATGDHVIGTVTNVGFTFTIVWETDLLPEMTGVYIFVQMWNIGGYNATSAPSNNFDLENVPQVLVESVSPVILPDIIAGMDIQIIVNSSNYGRNASLYCIFDGNPYHIGDSLVSNLTIDYFYANFTWDSLQFTKMINSLPAYDDWYDLPIQFYVNMSNDENKTGFAYSTQTYTVINTPRIVDDFTYAGNNTVITGTTTITVNSYNDYDNMTAYAIVNGTYHPIGFTSGVTFVNLTNYTCSIDFDSLAFATSTFLTADVLTVDIFVNVTDSSNYTLKRRFIRTLNINNAPSVSIVAPSSTSGMIYISANNTREYVTVVNAYMTTWTGFEYNTTTMNQINATHFSLDWNSTFVSDNASFVINITIESNTGINASATLPIILNNGNDFVVFCRAGIARDFVYDYGTGNVTGTINSTTEDAYFKIDFINNYVPPDLVSYPLPEGFYLFDNDTVFDFRMFRRDGSTSGITRELNVTFIYDWIALQTFRPIKDLIENSIRILQFDGSEWIALNGTLDTAENNRTFSITGITSFSIFLFAAEEVPPVPPSYIEQLDFVSIFLLIGIIVGVIAFAMYGTRTKLEKEQIIPGKKKTCPKCGKYVKPYVTTCPYCSHKLTEEETMADAMNRLRHLFIFHEESGVCLYYHPFTESKIDPQLISGFLSAITSFGGQFTGEEQKKDAGKEKTTDLKELVYKEYRILMETSGACKFAVLIKGQTSKILTFKISQFVKHFIRTYQETLRDWKGNVRLFKDVEKMVRLIFGLTRVQSDEEKAGIKPAPAPEPSKTPSAPPTTPVQPPTLPKPPSGAFGGVKPGDQPGRSASLFALKDRIGVPGESLPPKKIPDEEKVDPLSWKLPSEDSGEKEKEKKKKKKK